MALTKSDVHVGQHVVVFGTYIHILEDGEIVKIDGRKITIMRAGSIESERTLAFCGLEQIDGQWSYAFTLDANDRDKWSAKTFVTDEIRSQLIVLADGQDEEGEQDEEGWYTAFDMC